jgi:hypothetical protein
MTKVIHKYEQKTKNNPKRRRDLGGPRKRRCEVEVVF